MVSVHGMTRMNVHFDVMYETETGCIGKGSTWLNVSLGRMKLFGR